VDEAKDVQLVHAIRLQKTSGCKKTSPFIDSSYKISMGFEKKKKKKTLCKQHLLVLLLFGGLIKEQFT